MSSEEDFSLVSELRLPSENTLEGVQTLIFNYKKKYEQLIEEQKELAACRDDRQDLTKQFRKRTEKLSESLNEDKRSHKQKMDNEKAKLNHLRWENEEIMKDIQEVNAALMEEEVQNRFLKEQSAVFTAVPEKNVFFNGKTAEPGNAQQVDMDSRIIFPMDGGTALITFEKEEVAKKILAMNRHHVDLGSDCHVEVGARPVHLMVPSVVEIDSEVCPRRVLISNLPKMNMDTMMNKLEIHFSKSRNGGGEVEECVMLPDSWTVVITFVEKGVASGVTAKQYHEVLLLETKHRVKVTPFLNGTITNLKTQMQMCPRTVLLTGIPAVMEQETLQDLLEIHFQKSTNGGEIEAFLYNELGQQASAVFEGNSQNGEDEKAAE